MVAGIILIAVAAFTLATIIASARSIQPHNRGCDCMECCRWYEQRARKHRRF